MVRVSMFKTLFSYQKPQLIPFLMVGYPSLADSEQLALALIAEGIEILELGVPFSDPVADGPIIQMAAEQALKNGTRLEDVFELCHRIHIKNPHVKLIIFSYLNPLLSYIFILIKI